MKLVNRTQSTATTRARSAHAARSAGSFQGVVDGVGGAFAKATAAFQKAMALESAFQTDARKRASVPASGRQVVGHSEKRSKARTWSSDGEDDQAAGGALFKV